MKDTGRILKGDVATCPSNQIGSITNVVITTSFPAIHCWANCPIEDVTFLRNPHRHVFHVTLKYRVKHNDRDIEFINKKGKIDAYIHDRYFEKDLGSMSCEQIAEDLLKYCGGNYCSVFEDNENGAEIIKL